ncbi:MAG: hypothetical protein IPM61_13480 [Chlorobi bacterium]|nr:MAG: hypothetical protein UZ07_CHB004000762 [Chlorobi bacterium OLB7]MBK8912327.1 hypothetical protein [Chlorobiota bacterium]
MSSFQIGDIFLFPLRDRMYGVGKFVMEHNLALQHSYMIAVYDRVIELDPAVLNDLYAPLPDISHELNGIEQEEALVNTVMLTAIGIRATEVHVVAHADIHESDRDGYLTWLYVKKYEALQKGLIKEEEEAAAEEETTEEEGEEMEQAEMEQPEMEGTEGEEDAGPEPESSNANIVEDQRQTAAAATIPAPAEPKKPLTMVPILSPTGEVLREVRIRLWHLHVFEVSVGEALFGMYKNFMMPELASTRIGAYIIAHYDHRNVGRVRQLADALVEGDFGAGHELIEFGDTAAQVLALKLKEPLEPEVMGDVLQILGDIGVDRGYDLIAAFVAEHGMDESGRYYAQAWRGYCNAVVNTGGDSAPLQPYLPQLKTITHPELRSDIRIALESVTNKAVEGAVDG